MKTVQTPDTRSPATVAEIRAAALVALDAWAVRSREEAANLLVFWRRASELLDQDVAAVLDEVFPGEAPGEHRAAGRFGNADFRDGYAAGYVDCVVEVTKRDAEQERPSETLEESRARLARHSLSALVTVGMLSEESAGALLSMWERRDRPVSGAGDAR